MPQNNYASLGLQQDQQGQFSPVAGFGVGEMPSAEEIGGMNWNQRMGLFTSQMGQSQQQAQQANLGLFSQQLNEVNNLGATGRQQISDVYSQERGRMSQSLASRGLGSTTAGSAMSAGLAGRQSRDVTRLEEGMTQQRLNVLNAASFRQPDMGGFYNQMMQAGAAGLGQKKPKQQAWWKGPALGAGLDWLTRGGGGGGEGGGGGGGQTNLGKILGGIGGLFNKGGGGGGGGVDPFFKGSRAEYDAAGGGGGGVDPFFMGSRAEYENAQYGGFISRGQSPGPAQQGGGGIAQQLGGLSGMASIGSKLSGLFGFGGAGAAGGGISMAGLAGTLGGAALAVAPFAAAAAIGYGLYKNRKDIKRETKRIFKQVGNVHKKVGKKVKRFFKKLF